MTTVLGLWGIVLVAGLGVWYATQYVLPGLLDTAFWMR